MHDWEHDQTNKGTYEPVETMYVFDHSHCLLVCRNCGVEWKCIELYPRSRKCEPTNDNDNV